jgi:hypothetical protein
MIAEGPERTRSLVLHRQIPSVDDIDSLHQSLKDRVDMVVGRHSGSGSAKARIPSG